MAVDLYCYIERLVGVEWEFIGELVPNEERQYDSEAPEFAPSHVLHSVQKELAEILLDTGWAMRASEPYTPVVPRRGKPRVLSRELANYFRFFDDDNGTVYTWFTTAELNAFNLSSHVMIRKAYVPAEVAHLFENCPFGFPSNHWPKNIPVSFSGWSRDGVEVQWEESYDSIIREFAEVVPPALTASGPPHSTRLVVMANW